MPKPKLGEKIEVKIESPAFGGFGVARHDGIVIFVRYAYPGEVVIAEITKRKKTALFADQVDVIEASQYRKKPPCEVFGICGGCSLQDLDFEAQFSLKVEVVEDCLRHIGKLQDLPEIEEIKADSEFRYRNKMELSFGESNGNIFLGQHIRGRFDRLVPAEKCLLMLPIGNQIATHISMEANRLGLEVYNSYQNTGQLRHLTLRFSETEGKVLAGVTVKKPELNDIKLLMDSAHKAFPELAGSFAVVNSSTGDTAKGEVIPLFGIDHIEEEMLGLRFKISMASFFQTNTRMARMFYNKILEFAETTQNGIAFDLFSGTGTITQLLSKKFEKVIAIENVEQAVIDARISAINNGINNTSFIFGSVEKQLPKIVLEFSPELVVLDPPRSGVAKKILNKIIECQPNTIVYASCNPSTLARDLSILSKAYSISRLAIVDMFPQTYHIESIVRLELR
ncbi:23S rRNA (uracil(1939)-C(5))-methyltransferase RlmD [bacterium]|nr:23S rRNA (uracil(1939)-C(5))-methyltransferase RlmD [bacterium]